MRQTPFHRRLAPLNQTHLWEHWAGYLSAVKYQHSAIAEYYALRNSVGLFDTSPLFKYRIAGPHAMALLQGMMVRDPSGCPVGRGQYTAWCNDDGFVLEDGVLLRTGSETFMLTTAKPNLDYLLRLAGSRSVDVEDVTERYGILAVQGPHAASLLAAAGIEVSDLPYFGVTTAALAGSDVLISRTGFTGDLGYEAWVESSLAEDVFDQLWRAGLPWNVTPVGARAVTMARLDAGYLLLDADFQSARHAWVDAERETPDELGLGWLVDISDDRPFVGREAIVAERASGRSRWRTVVIVADPSHFELVYNSAGLVAPKHDTYGTGSRSVYDRDFSDDPGAAYVGYVTSFMFSPLLKRNVGLAKLQAPWHEPDTAVFVETTVLHEPRYVAAAVVAGPLYDPPRRTAIPGASR